MHGCYYVAVEEHVLAKEQKVEAVKDPSLQR